jgi:BirA family biotin operon repressor/biotin-[acetyl-CoA-carboxylase] ligase
VWQDGKLGGILVEVSSHGDGSCHAVVGIGVNVCLDDSARAGIDSSWGRGPVDVSQATGGKPPSRNHLAAFLVNELHPLMRSYPEVGFEPYRTRWIESDLLAGQWVTVTTPMGQAVGRAAGVDRDGALLLQTAAGSQRFVAGEVRLRDP